MCSSAFNRSSSYGIWGVWGPDQHLELRNAIAIRGCTSSEVVFRWLLYPHEGQDHLPIRTLDCKEMVNVVHSPDSGFNDLADECIRSCSISSLKLYIYSEIINQRLDKNRFLYMYCASFYTDPQISA